MAANAMIPEKCTVLVVGGGPAGSYTACALAREGIDTVILEADTHPRDLKSIDRILSRYHIGESMLPSVRHYLRFIDLDSTFENHGFTKKVGAAFKMNPKNREGFTDFLSIGGPNNYSWNVIRSEADELLFRHAAKCGAKTFEAVKVSELEFAHQSNGTSNGTSAPGRAVSANWTMKSDGTTGTIAFDYIVDATGRSGLLTTKYLKNRHYSKALKNVANWAYYRGAGLYGAGTGRANSPFFEALRDESGWAWFIPLHNGTHSIGIVMNQDISTQKKKEADSIEAYFQNSLKLAPALMGFLGDAKRVTEIKAASDYSYHSDIYAFPNARIVGDAGCFIDPFFSSGVHLAVTGGLSAAATIAASIRGDIDEATAAHWHTNKTREGYARFCLVVLSAYKQMRNQKDYILSDSDEDSFDRAFSFFRPIIQGTADATDNMTQAELSKTIDFLTKALSPTSNPEVADGNHEDAGKETKPGMKTDGPSHLEMEALETLRTHHGKHFLSMEGFTTDVIDGLVPTLETGHLTLVPAKA